MERGGAGSRWLKMIYAKTAYFSEEEQPMILNKYEELMNG